MLRGRRRSCQRSISGAETWGRCPSDYNLLQSCASLSNFFLWWRSEKRLSQGEKGKGVEGGCVMDFWNTGWGRLRRRRSGWIHISRMNSGVCFLLWSEELSAISFSCHLGGNYWNGIWARATVYSRNKRTKRGRLNLHTLTTHLCTEPLPPHLPKFGRGLWMGADSIAQSGGPLIIHLRVNSSCELYLAI